jgi:hypothetical protein
LIKLYAMISHYAEVLVNVDGGDIADHAAWTKALIGQRGALVYAVGLFTS